MSKRAFDKIRAGLDSARDYLDGSANKAADGVHVPERIDVRKIHTRTGKSVGTSPNAVRASRLKSSNHRES
jgi:hypothetical protein